jgi:flagellar biosynthesis/type III secretory pathway M-ring protein FliF/YscJ
MFRPRTGMGFILLLVMILATLIVFIAWGVPSYSDYYTVYDLETNSTTYLRLAEDKARTFDLTDFFFDPDEDIVEYGVTSISEEELSYRITNSHLRLSPAKDWSGGTILQLYAVDSYGERAQSPDIFVEVLPVEDYSLREFFLLTCVYINLLVVLLLSILLYVVSSLRNRKKELARQHELEQKEKDRLKREREAKRLANKKAREAKKKAKEQQEKSSSPKV